MRGVEGYRCSSGVNAVGLSIKAWLRCDSETSDRARVKLTIEQLELHKPMHSLARVIDTYVADDSIRCMLFTSGYKTTIIHHSILFHPCSPSSLGIFIPNMPIILLAGPAVPACALKLSNKFLARLSSTSTSLASSSSSTVSSSL